MLRCIENGDLCVPRLYREAQGGELRCDLLRLRQ
jgi:hypothetical protein